MTHTRLAVTVVSFLAFGPVPACGSDTCGALQGDAELRNSRDMETFDCYTEIRGGLMINAPDGVTKVGLPNLKTVSGKVGVYNNHDLLALDLHALRTVGGALEISGNEALPTLDGLDDLISIGSDLLITAALSGSNASLVSLAGLRQVTHVGGNITITNNPSLPTCAAEALVAQLVDFTGQVAISGNDDTATCQ